MARALTGIKPTGNIHLGNYLGAVKPGVALQDEYDTFYFVADYHALTSQRDPESLRRQTREIAATFLACGLDPERAVLFRQSSVPEVCELSWVLSCNTPYGQVERAHAFKAARDAGAEINAGTAYYPLLMAADILLYDSDVVPVGQDQKQHVEITRDLAVKLNHHYGADILRVPEAKIREDVASVPGLDGLKMSKSYGNEIGLWLTSMQLRKRVMKVVTDSLPLEAPKDPSTCNVVALYRLFASEEEISDLESAYRRGGMGYGHAKQALYEVIERELAEPRAHYEEWMANPDRLEEVLAAGAVKARATASETLSRVRQAIGLL